MCSISCLLFVAHDSDIVAFGFAFIVVIVMVEQIVVFSVGFSVFCSGFHFWCLFVRWCCCCCCSRTVFVVALVWHVGVVASNGLVLVLLVLVLLLVCFLFLWL